ncbi:ABC transporter substrate-binding protein [Leifsonia shinshuensis]|uniref:Sugar ABC transporter substrate-binding protein n=1 Tax=Leifsonia shinshuensis TaxID=150026 RepID=A0A7G6Y9T6_9MICO|nr:sugar ABC transporter substrate-binding protein [Leifsonia shinshuensis]QNE35251.1 sugar ABC transporter substrate-binding protein [Leifsonia shinshuensis]
MRLPRTRTRTRTRSRRLAAAATAVATASALLLSGCAAGSPSEPKNTVSYWLWDSNQLPAYEKCAAGFEKENPGLTITITQLGWNDYWTKLTAGFIAGTQPDVFTDHISKFAQFVDLGVLQPLDELDATKGIDDSIYQPGLAGSWMGPDGHRYGTPKDWDTISVFYNKKVTTAAGVSDAQLNDLSWNPTDGGSFEKTLAHLTIDKNGVRGDQPGFDKNHVATYGLATNDAGGFDGQTQWSSFTGSTGWNYTDKNPWGTHYNYDDKRFQDTISWYFGLAKKGYLAPFTDFSASNGPEVQLGSGKAALSMNGSWMISTYAKLKGVDLGIALTPTGPTGKRASMLNGLADSITKNAANKPGAAKWVAYLASPACQNVVGQQGIVFPAAKSGTLNAIAAYKARGIDVTPFTKQVADKTTFSFPITNYAADVAALMVPAMQNVYANGAPVSTLTTTNKQIDQLFQQGG